jgi:hypothetical protein
MMAPSKNSFPPPFAPSRPTTCTKNKDARLGAIDLPKPHRTAAEMQAIWDQQAFDKQEKERNQLKAMRDAAYIEDQQFQEDLQRAAQSNVRKPRVASFRPPAPTVATDVDSEDEIRSVNSEELPQHMSMSM